MQPLRILFLVFPLLLLANSAYGQDNPRDHFEVDPDGTVHTDDGKAERAFSLPPIKTGFLVDVYNPSIDVHLSLELVNVNDFTFDVGVASDRVFVAVTWEFIPVIKIGPSVWGGYNVSEKEPSFGVGFSVLEF